MEAAYLPQVTDELDTQNFEKFEEVNVASQGNVLLSYQKFAQM
jgi:hypothetical protein